MQSKEYLMNIDIFRFIFAVMIVVLHFSTIAAYPSLEDIPYYQNIVSNVSKLGWCVELFFILSGFFLIATKQYEKSLGIYIKNRIQRLWPIMIFTLLLFVMIIPLKIVKFNLMENLFTLLFANGIEIAYHQSQYQGMGNLHAAWFVSVLVYVSFVYLYIIKKFGFNLFNLIMMIFIPMGMHLMTYHMTRDMFYVIPIGEIRGVTCIAIGCILGEIYNNYKDEIRTIRLNKLQSSIVTIIEISLFFYLIFALSFSKKDNLTLGDAILIFIFLVVLFIIKKGYFSVLLNNKVSYTLGKYSYSIFITHCFFLEIAKNYYYKKEIYNSISRYNLFQQDTCFLFFFFFPILISIGGGHFDILCS